MDAKEHVSNQSSKSNLRTRRAIQPDRVRYLHHDTGMILEIWHWLVSVGRHKRLNMDRCGVVTVAKCCCTVEGAPTLSLERKQYTSIPALQGGYCISNGFWISCSFFQDGAGRLARCGTECKGELYLPD